MKAWLEVVAAWLAIGALLLLIVGSIVYQAFREYALIRFLLEGGQ